LAPSLAAVPPFTVILVDDLSRLSRDLVETLKLYRRLQRHGVELVAVTDGIQTTHQMAKLQITIKGLVNKLYLDDLRDKTHRGMTGRALKGLSTGGRLFGYRTTRGAEGAERVVFEPEAGIVRRIFSEYAGGGLSMKALVLRLNAEGVPFPAKVTRRGPTRRGWAVSTIHTILMNEKYLGRWAWNKMKFVKDPETGKRTATRRPKDDWVIEDRPELAIVSGDLWTRVQDRLEVVRAAYGATGGQKRPRGQAPELYSSSLLSGLIRCASCGARITIQTSQRKKNGVVYRYRRYRCSFHVAKGPSICANRMSIPQPVLDARVVEKFRSALTPEMIDYLVASTNAVLNEFHDTTPQEVQVREEERRRIGVELSNLVEFVIRGTPRPRACVRRSASASGGLPSWISNSGSCAARRRRLACKLTVPGSRGRSRGSASCWQTTPRERVARSRSMSRICGSCPRRRSASGSSSSPGARKSTASSAPRRPCAYNWLRGLDLNQRPLMG